eukprot:CAMPEP_0174301606 /NCGR_PEP_ID=MMETSP0809-20121228/59147_1 /TAXON_ID=73025 ORGANISM="Eutreptiella gymnastica-like, Strain CCMP1594" /NCGR_SAMPLE_ID=MMETSP0809 /ASSEMBLY_ACC=CAM_ASM_000658 /LENGTH=97 /DNA_ID=CAMNT_0015407385 /DNA_START=487 /DNA_END=780 /DNA_ORIENTATION=-
MPPNWHHPFVIDLGSLAPSLCGCGVVSLCCAILCISDQRTLEKAASPYPERKKHEAALIHNTAPKPTLRSGTVFLHTNPAVQANCYAFQITPGLIPG